MTEKIEKFIIDSEDAAFDFLALTQEKQLDENIIIEFKGWPVFQIRIEGEDFYGTFPTRIMPPILELQKEIRRIYCKIKYSSESLQKLTEQDKKDTEIVVQVNQGSSEFIALLEKTMNLLLENPKMTGDHIAIIVIGIGTMITGGWMWKAWLNKEAQKNAQDTTVKFSEQETQRLKVIQNMQSQHHELAMIASGVDQFRYDLSRKLDDNDLLHVQGKRLINGYDAKELTKTVRDTVVEVRIDGLFTILSVDSGSLKTGFKMSVKEDDTGKQFNVIIPDGTLSNSQKEALKHSEWDKSLVYLQLNAKKSRGTFRNVTLVDALIDEPKSKE